MMPSIQNKSNFSLPGKISRTKKTIRRFFFTCGNFKRIKRQQQIMKQNWIETLFTKCMHFFMFNRVAITTRVALKSFWIKHIWGKNDKKKYNYKLIEHK